MIWRMSWHGPNEASESADSGELQLREELRASEADLDSTAARSAAQDWSRMAQALGLPEREMLFQVVKGLVAVMTDAAIRHALDIKPGTMRTYMNRLFRMFGTHARGEIAMKAVEAMRTRS